MLKDEDFQSALSDFSEAIRLQPNYALAYFNRAFLFSRQWMFNKAIEDYDVVFRLDQILLPAPYRYLLHEIPVEHTNIKSSVLMLYLIVREMKNYLHYSDKNINQVYHFTNLNCLKELAKGNPFRFYNISHMNDPAEGNVLFDLFENYINFSEERTKFWEKGKLKKILGYHISQKVFDPTFIGSFVKGLKNKDNLLMWQSYGQHAKIKGAGCNLIFNMSQFNDRPLKAIRSSGSVISKHILTKITKDNMSLSRIVYIDADKKLISDDSELEKLFKETSRNLLNVLYNLSEERNFNVLSHVKKLVRGILSEVRYLFKLKEYEFENEVRVVFKPEIDRFEESNLQQLGIQLDYTRLIPHYFLDVIDNFKPVQIMFGYAAKNFEEWKTYLKIGSKLRLDNNQIIKSKIGFREK